MDTWQVSLAPLTEKAKLPGHDAHLSALGMRHTGAMITGRIEGDTDLASVEPSARSTPILCDGGIQASVARERSKHRCLPATVGTGLPRYVPYDEILGDEEMCECTRGKQCFFCCMTPPMECPAEGWVGDGIWPETRPWKMD